MANPKCVKCGKTVYVTEKLDILNKVWHKGCFRCAACNQVLNVKTYQSHQGKPYCKPHYPTPTHAGVQTPPGAVAGDAAVNSAPQ